jgi:hypothetical protein
MDEIPMDGVIELPKSETQIAEERMAAVERQIHRMCKEGPRPTLCPYCGHWNLPKTSFCCETMRMAVVTVLAADRMIRNAQAAERAANN